MLHKLLLKLLLFIHGIRFYKTVPSVKSTEFRRACFQTVSGHLVEFLFYREECEDIISRWGRIRRKSFVGYVVCVKFDDHFPADLHRYDNMHFFFNSRYLKIVSEERICHELMSIYIDFIKHQLLQQK